MPQTEALFDICVVDTDTWSYCDRSPMEVLTAAEKEKKDKYTTACEERRALFTPLCVFVDGMMGERQHDSSKDWQTSFLSSGIGIITTLCVG